VHLSLAPPAGPKGTVGAGLCFSLSTRSLLLLLLLLLLLSRCFDCLARCAPHPDHGGLLQAPIVTAPARTLALR
jgi:hypothetical protein